jgi:hypothetical protein
VLTQPGTTISLLNPVDQWGTTLANIARGLPVVIGYTNGWRGKIFGVLDAIRLCFFAIAAVVVFFAPAGDGRGSTECHFFARVSGAMLLTVLVVLMVGRLISEPGSDRYLVPPALFCLAALMGILWCRLNRNTFGIIAVASLFACAFCGGAVVLVARALPSMQADCDARSNICSLEAALAKTGIRQGYATYWNGNSTTLVSHGEIRTCGVVLNPQLGPFRWLVSKDCFDTPSEDRFFLALERGEIGMASRERLVREAGAPDEIVRVADYEIWIYTTAKANLAWLRR